MPGTIIPASGTPLTLPGGKEIIGWKCPDPTKPVATGTTGILVSEADNIVWTNRIRGEDKIHRKPTTVFSWESSVRRVPVTNAPQNTSPENERGDIDGLDVSRFGYDPSSTDGKQIRRAVDKMRDKLGPHDKKSFPECAQEAATWHFGKPSEHAHIYRSASVPKIRTQELETQYDFLTPHLQKAQNQKEKKRQAKEASATASIEQAMAKARTYGAHGEEGKRWRKPNDQTDVTTFQAGFIMLNAGKPMHKCDPKPVKPITLRLLGKQDLCPVWV